MRLAEVLGYLILGLLGIKRKDYPRIEVIDESPYHAPVYPTANMYLTSFRNGYIFTCVAQSLVEPIWLGLVLTVEGAEKGNKRLLIGPVRVPKGRRIRIREKIHFEGEIVYASVTSFEVEKYEN